MQRSFALVFLLFLFLAVCADALADGAPLDGLLRETASYFTPLQGKIVSLEGKQALISVGPNSGAKAGMRLQVFREDAPFRHPVTKEPLGKLEVPTGKVQLKDVAEYTAIGEVIEGEAKVGDTVRISKTKINLLFCQSRDTDWQVAEYYYRKLKESGRFNMIDTALEPDRAEDVIGEARRLRADAALHIRTKRAADGASLVQDLYWASDGTPFGSAEARLDDALPRELTVAEKYFSTEKHAPLTAFEVPPSARLLVMCDADGDGKKELIFSAGNDIIVYAMDKDLHPALGGITIAGGARDNHIWIDAIDLNKNGRDEIIVTSMRGTPVVSNYEEGMQGDGIISSVFEYDGKGFVLLYRDSVFMRNVDDRLYAQAYSRQTGFDGDVFELQWDGTVKRGDPLKLPGGVNIYDFVFFKDPALGDLLLAYDEGGYLSVYDGKGTKLWKSSGRVGDFLTTFKKKAPSAIAEGGSWAVKDRLFIKGKDALYVKRIPFVEMVKGLGFKKSQVRLLRWNGIAMEDRPVVDGVNGTLLDYAVTNNNIFVLSSPLFGIRAGNILKGDNPIKRELSVYPFKSM